MNARVSQDTDPSTASGRTEIQVSGLGLIEWSRLSLDRLQQSAGAHVRRTGLWRFRGIGDKMWWRLGRRLIACSQTSNQSISQIYLKYGSTSAGLKRVTTIRRLQLNQWLFWRKVHNRQNQKWNQTSNKNCIAYKYILLSRQNYLIDNW